METKKEARTKSDLLQERYLAVFGDLPSKGADRADRAGSGQFEIFTMYKPADLTYASGTAVSL